MIWLILACHTTKRPVMSKKAHTKENSKKPISHELDTAQATSRYIPVKPVTARLPFFSSSTATGFLLFAGERMSPFGALILQLDRLQAHPCNLQCKLPLAPVAVLHQIVRHTSLSVSRMKSTHLPLPLTWNNLASVSWLNFTLMCGENVSPSPCPQPRLTLHLSLIHI